MALRRADDGFTSRYSPGGDEFVMVELDQAMSLETNLYVQQVAAMVDGLALPGVLDVCPAHISYLVRFDPDVTSLDRLTGALREVEAAVTTQGLAPIRTRVVDLPILFGDPWTHDVVMRFRDRVQEPSKTDIEYLTTLNGLGSAEQLFDEIVRAPGLVTMTGYIPGVLCTYALVDQDRQIEAPKYLRPRTETPERALGFGGASRVVYPVPSAGGFPLVGRAAAPVFDRERRLPDFRDSAALVRLGDIYSYRSVSREEYDEIQGEVEAGTFTYRQQEWTFDPATFFADHEAYCRQLKGVFDA